jgi:hypothetical protein
VARPLRFIGAGRSRAGHGRLAAGKRWTPAESRPGAVQLGPDGLHGGLVAGPAGWSDGLERADVGRKRTEPKI